MNEKCFTCAHPDCVDCIGARKPFGELTEAQRKINNASCRKYYRNNRGRILAHKKARYAQRVAG